MTQINIKINEEMDHLLDYFAQKKKIPKAVFVKELLVENLKEKLLPQLLKEYEAGQISLKKILYLTEITPEDLLEKLREFEIECPITPDLDDYTSEVSEDLMKKLKI